MIIELKFTDAEFTGRDIASLPDRPGDAGITAAQLKERFDAIPKMMIALGSFNTLIDALTASTGAGEIGAVVEGLAGGDVQALLTALKKSIDAHAARTDNPHGVTKALIGLGSADNTADMAKPVSNPQQAALNAIRAYIDSVVLRAGAVTTVFGRAGDILPQAGDYTAEMVTGATRLYIGDTEPDGPGPYIWLQPTDSSIGLLALGTSVGDGLNVAVDDQTLAVTNAEAGTSSGDTLSYTIR